MKKILLFVLAGLVFALLASALINIVFYLENEKSKSIIFSQAKQINETESLLERTVVEARLLNSSLKKTIVELEETKTNLKETQEKLSRTKSELNETISELNIAKEELNLTKGLLNKTNAEMQKLWKELDELEQTINESISWFKINSALPSSADSFIYRVQSKCIKENMLNLACISYLMSTKLHMKYIKESADHLISVEELITRQGGDCEDFALFLKATLNTLKPLENDVMVEGWEMGEERYVVYVEKASTSTIEYYVDGHAISLGKLSEIQPYVVCYAVDYYSGHCVVALSKNKITSPSELEELKGAKLFEPQNGMYIGEIENELFLCSNGQSQCERTPKHIGFVITDSDLYQFSNSSWRGYSLYLNRTTALREAFEKME